MATNIFNWQDPTILRGLANGVLDTDAVTVAQLNAITPGGSYSNANVTGYLASNANIAITVQGNVQAGYFIGNGSLLTGLPAGYGNANLANLGSNVIITTGNVTAGYFIGNGSALSSITAANVEGTVAVANTVAANVQPNITSVGTLANLTVTDFVVAGRLEGNGNTISNIQWANITNANTQIGNYLASNANVQITTTGNIVSSGNITADLFIGNFQGNITGNLVVPGSNTEVIFNDNGNAGADAGFTYDAGNAAAVIANSMTVGNTLTSANVAAGNVTVTGITDLGAVANLVITGGLAGQFITTDGLGNLSFAAPATAIPAVYFTATVTGNNQTFANTELTAYAANTDMSLFFNGALLDSSFYTLSGDTVTVNTPLNTGDSISITRQFAATATTIATNPYGNANVAAYLPTYTGNISAGNVIMPTAQTPASSLAVGTTGQMVWDGNYIYLCIAPNTWKRVALSSF